MGLFEAARFTRGDVIELAGIGPVRLARWCRTGVIEATGGVGAGNHRTFTLTQVVGVAVAWRVYTGEVGCGEAFVRATVAAFARVTEADLARWFRDGQVRLAPIDHSRGLCLTGDGERWGWVNVKDVFEDVVGRAAEMRNRECTRDGRRRGLARSRIN